MANEARAPREVVDDVQSRLRAMDLCGVIFVDSWGEECMCILPTPCERHRDAADPLRQPGGEVERLREALAEIAELSDRTEGLFVKIRSTARRTLNPGGEDD